MSASRLISIDPTKARLKRKIRAHLKSLGFQKASDGSLVPPSLNKDAYRDIHRSQRKAKFIQHKEWINDQRPLLGEYFASGCEVDVFGIRPQLELAPGDSWQGDLFRLAGLFWKIPVSEGYGRRIRFLVWDRSNGKLIGLLALGDAVFNLHARDEYIGWSHARRSDALVHLMDAYVLGALPPYNRLLGGKLIASLLKTKDIVKVFNKRYRSSTGVISQARKDPRLAAITTTSALGRSSIYNRVKLQGELLVKPIGYTSGFGHFHISDDLFEELRLYLKSKDDPYADGHKFGSGSNWRIRVIRRALSLVGLKADLIKHGFPREVFFCPIAKNAIKFLQGTNSRVLYGDLPSVASVGQAAIERWCIPRAQRMPDYLDWKSDYLFDEIKTSGRGQSTLKNLGKVNALGKR